MNNLLMIPGPTTVPKRVLNAMANPIISHRSNEFGKILEETSNLMSSMFKTDNQSLILSGSGTSAMEASIINVVKPHEKIINIAGGKFGERLVEISKVHELKSLELNVEWNDVVNPKHLKEMLDENEDVKAVTLIHNETSTGTKSPLKEVGKIMRNYDALLIVDTVSSFAGDYVEVDKYGIDVCFTGSQKCVAAPPGIVAITLSDDAWNTAKNVKPHTYYLNLIKARQKSESHPPQTPFTPAISSIYGFREALKIIDEEGIENTIKRHIKASIASRNAAKALEFELYPKYENIASNTVTTLKVPENINASDIRNIMKNDYQVEIAGGQDKLKDHIIRIGHMGTISYQQLAITYTALGLTMKKLGSDIDEGAGVCEIAKNTIKG